MSFTPSHLSDIGFLNITESNDKDLPCDDIGVIFKHGSSARDIGKAIICVTHMPPKNGSRMSVIYFEKLHQNTMI